MRKAARKGGVKPVLGREEGSKKGWEGLGEEEEVVKASRLTQPLAGAQGNGVKSLYCEHISRGHNSIIPSMVGSNARYISQDLIGIPVRKKTDTALQCLTISMSS